MSRLEAVDTDRFREAIIGRALALYNQGSLPGAEVLLDTLGDAGETMAPVQHMRGLIAAARGDAETARNRLARAVALDPSDAGVHANLGGVLLSDGNHAGAAAACEAALLLQPAQRAALLNAPKAYIALGLPDIGIDACREALTHLPTDIGTLVSLAGLLDDIGDFDAADALFQDAVAAEPERAELHVAWAMLLFAAGHWQRAWLQYEWRRRDPHNARSLHSLASPLWQGEDLAGKTVALQADHNLHDVIRCIRFAADLKARGAQTLVQAPAIMGALLAAAPGVDEIADSDIWIEPRDFAIPVTSLPHMLGIASDSQILDPPYLVADPVLHAAWRERMPVKTGLTVGLSWDDIQPTRRRQHPQLHTALRLLLDCPGVQFVSLQMGEQPDAIEPIDARMVDLRAAHPIESLSDMAAIVANLDLVIAIDGTVGHLAAALGRETWLLLTARPDGRWLRDSRATMWYPQARLFRQPGPESWHTVAIEARDALCERLGCPPLPQAAATSSQRDRDMRSTCDALFLRGTRLYQNGIVASAKSALECVLVHDDTHVQTLCNLAALECQRGAFDRGTVLARRALACAPDQPAAHLALGNALLAQNNAREAIAQYRSALQRYPKDGDLHGGLAQALSANGQFSEAMPHFEQAVWINQQRPARFYLKLGQTLSALERWPSADTALRHALATDPEDIEIQHALQAVSARIVAQPASIPSQHNESQHNEM